MNLISQVAGTVVGQALNVIRLNRPWSSGLCDCCKEIMGCCDVYCCTCCATSRQCMAVDGTLNSFDCCYCLVSLLAMYYGYNGTGLIAMILRYRVIEKYGIINEGAISTFCIANCCPYCSLCQTHRELDAIMQYPGYTCCVPPKVV